MDKKIEASTTNPAQKTSTSSTPTDDESITTSTESELFETWTLVKDKSKKNPPVTAVIDDDAKSIEIPEQYKKDEQHEGVEHDEPKPDYDSNIDDLSDGISIISESESGGRVSPHPYLREHLNNLHLQYSSADVLAQSFSNIPTIPPNAPVLPSAAATAAAALHSKCDDTIDYNAPSGGGATTDNQLLRQRRRKRSASVNSNTNDKKALQTVESIVSTRHMPPIVQRGLTGIFYVAVALAILALIGKLRYPEWRPLSSTSDSQSMAALQQKLNDMELQNNLMRAEIDILSKQVNYLSDLNENNRGNRDGGRASHKEQLPSSSAKQRHQQPKRAGEWVMEQKGGKTFKAWSGNGKSMHSVDITKDDLKRPYKCPDGKYVEIAGMCVEDAIVSIEKGDEEEEEALLDQIGNIINDVLTESQTYETVKAAADKLQTVVAENEEEKEEQANTATEELNRDAKVYSLKDEHKEDKRTDRREEKYQKNFKRSYTSAENRDATFANSKERGKYEKRHQYQKQHHQHKHHEHDDDDDDIDSDEVYKKHDNQRVFNNNKNYNDHSKENSKERFNKPQQQQQRRKFSTSPEEQSFHKDGQWHEKLMQQRENVRRKNDRHRNDKNWYIERGNSREQMRHS